MALRPRLSTGLPLSFTDNSQCTIIAENPTFQFRQLVIKVVAIFKSSLNITALALTTLA